MKKIINSKFVLFILLAIFSACVSSSKMKNKHYQQWSDVSENEVEKTESTIVYIETNNSFETEILNESISIHTIVSAENSDFNQNQSIHSKSSTNKKVTGEDFSLSDLKFKKQLKSSLFPSPLPATADLSLLWIVIIILLVLWALGLISGNFGGLIHLLLVIALILLILWLLKII
jgi:hypothetical protein